MTQTANVIAVDHTGFAVSSLDESIRFWTQALGFTLQRQSEMGGEFLRQVTGVDDPRVRTAIVEAPDGFVIELLQYSGGREHGAVPESAGAIGAAHLALAVKDIHIAIERVEAAGWKAKGGPQPIPGGPRKGTLLSLIHISEPTRGDVGCLCRGPRSHHDRVHAAASGMIGRVRPSRACSPSD